ncbi:MAG: MFS transporter [Spirochaetales bacterium]|nr:MFS transporter [Spirochaetales bacterium]
MTKSKNNKYGGIIVGIFILGAFTYQYLQYQLSIVAPDLIGKLNLTAKQFSGIFSGPLVPAVALSIIFGIIADKLGMKVIIAIAMFVSVIGGIGHIYAGSYGTMYTMMILTGFGAVAVNVTCGKMFSMWVRPELISVVMGVFLAASTVGQFVAQSTTALLGSMNTAFWISGLLCCIVFLLWVILGREKKEQDSAMSQDIPSIGETLKVVFSSKNMWLCAIGLFLILGCQVGFNMWIPATLVSKGMSQAQAGVIASTVSLGNLCGAIIMPIIAAKLGKNKPFIIVFTLICAAGYSFGWHLSGVLCYVCFFIFGLCASALMPFFISMPLSFPEIGPKYAGTAIGFISTLELLGAVVLPTYVFLPLSMTSAGMNYSRYYLVIGIGWLLAFVIGLLLPETAAKKQLAKESAK